MGTKTLIHIFNGNLQRAELRELINDLREEDVAKLGWAKVNRLGFSEQTFGSEDSAREYIDRELAPGGPIYAVRIRQIKANLAVTVEKKIWEDDLVRACMSVVTELNLDIKNGKVKFQKLEFQIFKEFKNASNNQAECVSCESKITRKYLTSFYCPVCDDSLISLSEDSPMAKLNKSISVLQYKLNIKQKDLREHLTLTKRRIAESLDADEYRWMIAARIRDVNEDRVENERETYNSKK